jgi:5-methylcytosine-specific restriction endonuclease McrA
MTNPCTLCSSTENPFPVYTKGFYAGKQYPHCKPCKRKASARYYAGNKETVLAGTSQYQKAHPEVCARKRKVWATNNPTYHKTYYDAHKPARTRKRLTVEQKKQYIAQWCRDNKERRVHYRHNRRAAKLSTGSFTSAEWEALKAEHGNVCLRCGTSEAPLTPDHVVPLSRGGSGFISNIQPLCLDCNRRKATKSTDYRAKERT